MKPHVVLRVENFTPSIHYIPQEGVSRKMTKNDENLLELIKSLAQELDLETQNESDEDIYEDLLRIARESDEFYLPEHQDLNPEETEFELDNLFTSMLEKAQELDQEYGDVKMDDEIRKELDQNQSADVFASILESVYLRLIAKTLIAASELGIGEIHLADKHKNPRLADQMKKELDKMGVELVID